MNSPAMDKARYSRAQWLTRFETAVIKLMPKMRGRIDIETGHYYYCQGLTPVAAATAWVGELKKVK